MLEEWSQVMHTGARMARLLLKRKGNDQRCASWHPNAMYSWVWMAGSEAQRVKLCGQVIFLP